jgi:cyclopropane fatty-acyl-phospholipid synthase-like methyltransferase
MAQLLGLDPTPPESCRVLELACGDGSNVVGFAAALPRSRFVGIDLASRAVAAGRELVAHAGLDNVQLEVGDIADIPADLGRFDYVIAHGVYSWVDDRVREGLLATIAKHLSPTGVGFVSFSCYPGAYFRDVARDLMTFHTGQLQDPTAQLQQGIDFLRFIREAHGNRTAYAATLDQEINRVTRADPGYVFHDDFSEHNTPVYFAAFVAHLREHGLDYLCDATFDFFFDRKLAAPVREQLAQYSAGDRIVEQQYLDFVRGTPFRQVLVYPRGARPEPILDPTRLLPLFARAPLAVTAPEPDLRGGVEVSFRARNGSEVASTVPLAKALLFELSRAWPEPRRVKDLVATALARLEQPALKTGDDAALRIVANTLLGAAASQTLSLWAGEVSFVSHCGDYPLASPLARAQARHSDLVTTLRNTTLRLADEPARQLLTLADGTRTRDELLVALKERLAGSAGVELDTLTAAQLEATLSGLAERGFMLG